MAKVTLSVPDDLYEKFEKHKNVLNLSELFREAVSEKIEQLEGRSEIIKALCEYLKARSPDKDTARKLELKRFTAKWGLPDTKSPDDSPRAEPPYIFLEKQIEIKPENAVFTTLRVMNGVRVKSEDLREFDAKVWKDYAFGRMNQIVESFKQQGFTVGESYMIQADVINLVTDGRKRDGAELSRLYGHYGLWAVDDKDTIFITYRQVKRGR